VIAGLLFAVIAVGLVGDTGLRDDGREHDVRVTLD
jgi:hypothetical protein